MIDKIKSVWHDEEGLTTVEYALLLALLVVAAIGVWTVFGRQVRTAVGASSNAIGNSMTPS